MLPTAPTDSAAVMLGEDSARHCPQRESSLGPWDPGANLETSKFIFFRKHLVLNSTYIYIENAFTSIIYLSFYYSEINIISIVLQMMNARLSVTYPNAGSKLLLNPSPGFLLLPQITGHASLVNYIICF